MATATPPDVRMPAPLRRPAGPWPARLDVLQSASGLALALFMCAHMAFVASILLGPAAMWRVTRFFEGYYLTGRSYPALVAVAVALVLALVVVHAALAIRKLPGGYREYSAFRRHQAAFGHDDTGLWALQAGSGFVLFFLVPAHLYGMLVRPERIGPYASADSVWSDGYWPLYLLLLGVVWLHAGAGVYRLAIKWGWPAVEAGRAGRLRLRRRLHVAALGCVLVGLVSLGAYAKLGREHALQRAVRSAPIGLR